MIRANFHTRIVFVLGQFPVSVLFPLIKMLFCRCYPLLLNIKTGKKLCLLADQYHCGQKVAFFFFLLPTKQPKCLGLIIIKEIETH